MNVKLKAPRDYLLLDYDEDDSSGPGVEIVALYGAANFDGPNPGDVEELRQLVEALNIGFTNEKSSWTSYGGEHASVRLFGPCRLVERLRANDSIIVQLLSSTDGIESYIQLQDKVQVRDEEVLIITFEGSFDTPERVAALKALGFEEVSEE